MGASCEARRRPRTTSVTTLKSHPFAEARRSVSNAGLGALTRVSNSGTIRRRDSLQTLLVAELVQPVRRLGASLHLRHQQGAQRLLALNRQGLGNVADPRTLVGVTDVVHGRLGPVSKAEAQQAGATPPHPGGQPVGRCPGISGRHPLGSPGWRRETCPQCTAAPGQRAQREGPLAAYALKPASAASATCDRHRKPQPVAVKLRNLAVPAQAIVEPADGEPCQTARVGPGPNHVDALV